jgi:pyrimidine operon attenuation protein/uracil phosphoribosyltransferase
MQRTIMDTVEIQRAVTRIAHEIVERNKGAGGLILIVIRTGGVYLAQRLARKIFEVEKETVPLGELDITLYRDDLNTRKEQPSLKKTHIPVDITDKRVVLVDDVLFTGRTIRAAMDGLMDFGRPRQIQLAVLIDRGHRELPIRPDYIGKNLPTAIEEKVEVLLEEKGEEDRVVLHR